MSQKSSLENDLSDNASTDSYNSNGMNESTDSIQVSIDTLNYYLRRYKQKKQLAYLCQAIFYAVTGFVLISFLDLEPILQYLTVSIIGIFSLSLLLKRQSYRAISLENFLEHLNRQFSEYQESAQLVNQPNEQLSLLKQIQKKFVYNLIERDISNGQIKKVLPAWPWKDFLIPLVALIISLLVSWYVVPKFSSEEFTSRNSEPEKLSQQDDKLAPKLTSSLIQITPPQYTKLPSIELEDLNLEILEGSQVEWSVQFNSQNNKSLQWLLIDADNNQYELTLQDDARYQLKLNVQQTTFYRFGFVDPFSQHQEPTMLDNIYSIAVIRDQLPKIRLAEPSQTLVEIPKSEEANFNIEAHIEDDFGINSVSILASVAKGSGEAVKFRDETFMFDSFENLGSKSVYKKSWSLKSLGMEPGDEVYFSVIALDNKAPEPQRNKSSSVIVRWLDDEIVETAVEGIQIRFIPEFFRSQRQIIIETEQLIADRKDLFPTVFKEKSVDLGFSQRDLKEKYGQYLGDEFGEGPAPDSVEMHGLADGYHGGEDVAQGEASAGLASHLEHLLEKGDGDDHAGHNHSDPAGGHTGGHEHQHGSEDPFGNSMVDSSDLSGASELIAQFAHNHGSAEIGPLSKRDPKSWMKRAVSVMWQAELHLMMHEPEKALPYEYEAYQYLKLARQAEKIYVKRLGFEPPPVKESNRLTGELKDILTYETSVEDIADESADASIISVSYQALNDPENRNKLSKNAKKQLSLLRDRLLELSETRPVLISYAATVEKVLVADSLILNDCDQCIDSLQAKLWQLAKRPISLPNVRGEVLKSNIESAQEFLNNINQLNSLILQTNDDLGDSGQIERSGRQESILKSEVRND
ncbi:hypothetical protein FLL45_19575 [Aliikangiella marina]|uniref:DUF4175 domain-containing protein n=1 Tax=Aliikangiella marina TaxID=1712262 RepID=A0A545T5A2_9GAMM|nr:DUF4175 family protein [Aliikangiella marina]TQV72411.1 hypothetical protein FLL45_19575 [Aliikangiella marina]